MCTNPNIVHAHPIQLCFVTSTSATYSLPSCLGLSRKMEKGPCLSPCTRQLKLTHRLDVAVASLYANSWRPRGWSRALGAEGLAGSPASDAEFVTWRRGGARGSDLLSNEKSGLSRALPSFMAVQTRQT